MSLMLVYILFNVLLAIVIIAFGSAGVNIGDAGSQYSSNDYSTGTYNSSTTTSGAVATFTQGWSNTLGGLPWWAQMLFVTFELTLFSLGVIGIVRGI